MYRRNVCCFAMYCNVGDGPASELIVLCFFCTDIIRNEPECTLIIEAKSFSY